MAAAHPCKRGWIVARIIWSDSLREEWIERRGIRALVLSKQFPERQQRGADRQGHAIQEITPVDGMAHAQLQVPILLTHHYLRFRV